MFVSLAKEKCRRGRGRAEEEEGKEEGKEGKEKEGVSNIVLVFLYVIVYSSVKLDEKVA